MKQSSSGHEGLHGTFAPNRLEGIHRWYPYVEGFSSEFVASLLEEFGEAGQTVHDPFAGTGTTVCVALDMGMDSTYCEINPFMRLVIETKTRAVRSAMEDLHGLSEYFDSIIAHAESNPVSEESALEMQRDAFGNSHLFSGRSLTEILAIRNSINLSDPECLEFKQLARLALGSIAVGSSDMIRRADLRIRRPRELNDPSHSPLNAYREKAIDMLRDLGEEQEYGIGTGNPECLSNSALVPHGESSVDLILTSPPYVNGTNYFRNTKIELWLTGYIDSADGLKKLRDEAMAAGINSISKRGRKPSTIQSVEKIATALDEVAYDKRIPELVRRYFSDTWLWLENSYNLLKEGGIVVVDIGDSVFSKVHIPADELLLEIAEKVGFRHIETRHVRDRHSNDGTPLKQVLHILSR